MYNQKEPPTVITVFEDMYLILPFSLIFISYFYISLYFCKYYRHFKNMNDQTKNEFRVTGILFLIFLFNAFVLGSMQILDLLMFEYKVYNETFYQAFEWFYFLPYCFNFFIYIGIIQYRRAFIYFLKKKMFFCCYPAHHETEEIYQNTEAAFNTSFRFTERPKSLLDC